MKDRLILLIGASGSGKTTLAKELEKEGYNIIHSYTTREPREVGEWGHTFIGVDWIKGESETNLVYFRNILENEVIRKDEVIAFKELYSQCYFATKNQYQGKGTSIYVIDPEGAEQVRENVKDAEIVTIFLMADEETRRRRMVEDDKRKYPLVTDRLRTDYKIFSKCKCDYVVDANRSTEEVLADVKEIING